MLCNPRSMEFEAFFHCLLRIMNTLWKQDMTMRMIA